MRLPHARLAAVAAVLLPFVSAQPGLAWGRNGHMLINRLAAETLPADVPAFLRSPAAADAMAYFGPEPDRWKSQAEPELSAASSPEHYMDLEWAELAGSPQLPRRRYDFLRALAFAQSAHPNLPLSPEKVGLQPYAASEDYERLKAAMREYRGLLAAHADTRPVEGEIVYLAGVLGHYVGDASQPLHTTIQYNGWTGPNPQGYTTLHTIHAQFESEFVDATVDAKRDVLPLIPREPAPVNDVFADYMAYLHRTHALVEQTYKLEKAGGFVDKGTPASRAFVNERLAAGATELRDMIYSAWVHSADPVPVPPPPSATLAPKPAG